MPASLPYTAPRNKVRLDQGAEARLGRAGWVERSGRGALGWGFGKEEKGGSSTSCFLLALRPSAHFLLLLLFSTGALNL